VVERRNSVPSTDAFTSVSVNTNEMSARELESLPRAYQLALRLRALGADHELIAECLDMPVDGVATLLAIGERKLHGTSNDVSEYPSQNPHETKERRS
jgi:DNA-directed RNA polymerase specialized sigma24 family protein